MSVAVITLSVVTKTNFMCPYLFIIVEVKLYLFYEALYQHKGGHKSN